MPPSGLQHIVSKLLENQVTNVGDQQYSEVDFKNND